MNEFPDFEQFYSSRTAEVIAKLDMIVSDC